MDKQAMFDKFIEGMAKFSEIKAVAALRDGFIMTTPFTIVGSLFLLLANLPFPGYGDMMAGMFGPEWAAPLNMVAGATFNILGLVVLLAVTYKFVDAEGCDAMMASLLSLSTFLIVLPPSITTKSGEIVSDVIPKAWAGSNGIITAIIVAFIVSYVCVYCEKNHIGIKMPASVPGGVVRAFEALTPGLILFTGGAIIYAVCHFAFQTTFPELIFSMIQTPLQSLSDGVVGGTIMAGLMSLLFWAGIHGPNVVGGVTNPIMLANALDNQALLDAGQTLVAGVNAHILTIQVTDVFMKAGGCGMTMGLLIASYLCAKSTQMKSVTKLATVPALFNINEPVIFGLPIVFNPYMIVPFILVPILCINITYAAIAMGFMDPFSAVQVPWTTPPIIAGLILDGIPGAIVQIITLAVSTAIYFPFVKAQDKKFCEEEMADAEANN